MKSDLKENARFTNPSSGSRRSTHHNSAELVREEMAPFEYFGALFKMYCSSAAAAFAMVWSVFPNRTALTPRLAGSPADPSPFARTFGGAPIWILVDAYARDGVPL